MDVADGPPLHESKTPASRRALAFALAMLAVAATGRLLAVRPVVRTVEPLAQTSPAALPGDPAVDRAGEHDRVRAGRGWSLLPRSPLSSRQHHASVWTGREFVVWGGQGDDGPLDDGAGYAPATRSWRRLPPSPLGPRAGHSAVWTGAEMIVWGGTADDEVVGAAFDPAAWTWRVLPRPPLEVARHHRAVWTGREMVAWGGTLADGVAYDPAGDRWRVLPPAPFGPRVGHTLTWTGTEVVAWGGTPTAGGDDAPAGAAYDPAGDRWRVLPPAPLEGRSNHSATWVPTRRCQPTCGTLVVWGGVRVAADGSAVLYDDGARYDPAGDTWSRLAAAPIGGRFGHAAVWATDRLVLLGGIQWSGVDDGAVWYPRTRAWSYVPAGPARGSVSATWTGSSVVAWGGAPRPMGVEYRPPGPRTRWR